MRLILLPQDQNIKTLTHEDVVHKYDVFDQVFLEDLLSLGRPRYLINDHFTSAEFCNVDFFGLPLYAEFESRKLASQGIFDDSVSTFYCFNFMINKKQVNRYLCMKLVEFYELKSFDYTWSGSDPRFDCTDVIQELDQLGAKSSFDYDFRQQVLAPIQLPKKFIDFQSNTSNSGPEYHNFGGTVWPWNNGLRNIFSNSAISLITESVGFQRASCFTEKTLYAILGLTFPIWIGGYNQAKEWKRMGFDIFDDIIDHSYQDLSTLTERCYYAFANNLDLLTDLQKTADLRKRHEQRLLNNRELLLKNQLRHFVDKEISSYPRDLQDLMPKILYFFREQTPFCLGANPHK